MTPSGKDAVKVLEEFFEPFVAPDHPDQPAFARARIAWRTLRKEIRDDSRISSTFTAAGANAALEIEATKKLAAEIEESANRALDHLRGGTKRERPPIPEDR